MGTWPAGGRSGHLKIDRTREFRPGDYRPDSAHAYRSQLAGTVTEGELVLELGTGVKLERSRVSLGDRQEAALGPYLIRSEGEIPNPTVDTAVITRRLGTGRYVTVKAPLGRAISPVSRPR